MTQELQGYWNRFSEFSQCVYDITISWRLKYRSQSKVLIAEELHGAEEQVLKMIQRESFPKRFSEKECFGKTKTVWPT